MKYLLMMNIPNGGPDHRLSWPQQIASWPRQDVEAHMAHMTRLAQKLRAAGELVVAEGLAGSDQAKLVRARKDGEPITDGVFPETKEFLAGYWIVNVESPERACAIAAEASAAPGLGGAPLDLGIEVRQILDAPPADLA
ncbi:YciI family protein [Chondromyces crocatus]|uniref:YCII-related domain-containing protein n=1 Tax=Chondromyces crocatus TaxID=52 RepID=A0A0K1E5E4_CHOCO|nr:YciI family protein [Chondromyces crocatus]AKT35917.1 uncharacterized protein CMC5_000280 [Chondromyces crocatus]